jgi:O-antigen/teichoic acid export membrane protein
MNGFSQKYSSAGPQSFIGRILALTVGLGMLAISVFVGAIFLAGLVGLAVVLGCVVALRVWWLKRKMQRYQDEHGDLEGTYTVVTEDFQTLEERRYKK